MLSGDFFYITNLDEGDGKITAVLELNATHKIFEGHFPGRPVVPGVCMIQMVKEILESVLEKSTRLAGADLIKFLVVIDPTENNVVHAEIKYFIDGDEKIIVGASLFNESVIYFRMNGIFLLV